MPIFAYEAINAKGQKETGELEAANRNQAILDIRNAGLKPTKVTQRADTAAAKQAAKADSGGTPGTNTATGAKRKRGRVSVQQVTDFTAQFAVLIDAGLPVALASDYNPGSAPSGNMPFVVALACIRMKMLPEEAINAGTLNGARAMELEGELGTIAVGKMANLIISKPIHSMALIPYHFGSNLVETVVINGMPVGK